MRDVFLGLIVILLLVMVVELNIIGVNIKKTFQIDVE